MPWCSCDVTVLCTAKSSGQVIRGSITWRVGDFSVFQLNSYFNKQAQAGKWIDEETLYNHLLIQMIFFTVIVTVKCRSYTCTWQSQGPQHVKFQGFHVNFGGSSHRKTLHFNLEGPLCSQLNFFKGPIGFSGAQDPKLMLLESPAINRHSVQWTSVI